MCVWLPPPPPPPRVRSQASERAAGGAGGLPRAEPQRAVLHGIHGRPGAAGGGAAQRGGADEGGAAAGAATGAGRGAAGQSARPAAAGWWRGSLPVHHPVSLPLAPPPPCRRHHRRRESSSTVWGWGLSMPAPPIDWTVRRPSHVRPPHQRCGPAARPTPSHTHTESCLRAAGHHLGSPRFKLLNTLRLGVPAAQPFGAAAPAPDLSPVYTFLQFIPVSLYPCTLRQHQAKSFLRR
eukprot:COSAG01_NODE_25057_length_757_cov_0.732523_1_plen_235_part_10